MVTVAISPLSAGLHMISERRSLSFMSISSPAFSRQGQMSRYFQICGTALSKRARSRTASCSPALPTDQNS